MGSATMATSWLGLAMLLSMMACYQPSAGQVLGDVFIYTNNYTFDPFPDLPADFGPEIPDDGIDGWLRVADPEDACQPFRYRHTHDSWVALISRSQQAHPTNCTFDVKVRHAEEAGASAAIVYDDVYEALIIMSKPRDHPDPGIPAVFVSEKAGIIMKKLITPGQTRVRIVAVSASAWMSLVMSAFLGFLALTVVLATFYVMRSWSVWLGRTRGRRTPADMTGPGGQYVGAGEPPTPGGLPACAIRALPVLIYEGRPSGSRRRCSTDGVTVNDALNRSSSVPVGQAAAGFRPPGPAATAPDVERGLHVSQQQQQGHTSAAVFLQESLSQQQQQQQAVMYSSSAPSVLPVGHRASSMTPASSNSSLASTAAQSAVSAVSAGALPRGTALESAAASVTIDVGLVSDALGRGSTAAANMSISPARSGTSTPLLSTDDDNDDSDLTLSVSGVITGGPPGARGGATRRTCVVCLERYQTGDKIRVLPCQHRFHARCIDPWLANRRLCPVCKHDASQPAVHLLPALGDAAVPAAAAAGAVAAESDAAAVERLADPSRRPGVARLLMGGFRWFRRLRARELQQEQLQQRIQPPADVTLNLPGVVGLGVGLPPRQQQRQLRSAAAYAAAAAAADAAENGLILPGSIRGMTPTNAPGQASAAPQQQWRRQRQRSGRLARQVLARQQDVEQTDLVTPLLPASSSTYSSNRRGRERNANAHSSSHGAGLGVVSTAMRYSGGGASSGGLRAGLVPVARSPPVPIPQLTPIHSDASSAGSQTPTHR